MIGGCVFGNGCLYARTGKCVGKCHDGSQKLVNPHTLLANAAGQKNTVKESNDLCEKTGQRK